MLFAVVKRYEKNGVDFADWEYKPDVYDRIYKKMMELTDNDHEISAEAASWCASAIEGEVYEFAEGEIEMVYIN